MLVECGAFEEADGCLDVCSGRDLSPRSADGYVADVGACLDDADEAEACRECFGVSGGCEAACALLLECNLAEGPPGECVEGCEQANRDNPGENQELIECLVDSLGENCDFEAVVECLPGGPVLPPG